MALFSKKPKESLTGDGWGQDNWGKPGVEIADPVDELDLARVRQAAEELQLVRAIEPFFLYVCEQRRIARTGKDRGFATVRNEVEMMIRSLQGDADRLPVLRSQVDAIAPGMIFFLDFCFADPTSPAAFREEWNRARLAADPSIISERHLRMLREENLSGDDAFFDLVDEELDERPDDRAANERLVFYYIAIGLGFLGFFRKGNEAHHDTLRSYMNRIYPRIKDWVDPRPDDRLTPGAYDFTNKEDFVTPRRDRPLILVAAFILLAMTLMVGYGVLFEMNADPLKRLLQNVGGFTTDVTETAP